MDGIIESDLWPLNEEEDGDAQCEGDNLGGCEVANDRKEAKQTKNKNAHRSVDSGGEQNQDTIQTIPELHEVPRGQGAANMKNNGSANNDTTASTARNQRRSARRRNTTTKRRRTSSNSSANDTNKPVTKPK